jgi:hypothetical protein
MDKDLTIKERHENFRKKLWCDVYVAYVSSDNSIHRDGAKNWADTALQRFDERFKIQEDIHSDNI